MLSQGKMCNSVRRWLSTKPTVVIILQQIQTSVHHIVHLETYTVFCVNYISESWGKREVGQGDMTVLERDTKVHENWPRDEGGVSLPAEKFQCGFLRRPGGP